MAKYITKEAIMKILNDAVARYADVKTISAFDALWLFKDDVIAMPSEKDVVEVKHGKWLEREAFYDAYGDLVQMVECSYCGEYEHDNDYTYCPHCGAKMDGSDSDE